MHEQEIDATLNPLETAIIGLVWEQCQLYETAMGIPASSRAAGPAQALVRAATFFLDACGACGGAEQFAAVQLARDGMAEPDEGARH